jgi:ABC-2 type transport system ATP-binding protein
MNAAIETDNLVKRYGDVTAVDGLSLSVASGEIYAFLLSRMHVTIILSVQ